jgi:hypothetical protein
MRVETDRRREPAAVAAWRQQQLADAGFPLALAREVAHDPAYDLHALIELVERGCPPTLAARIIEPPQRDAA